MLRWQDTGHKRWAVVAAYCALHACATFEIGFVYIVPLFGLAWLYTGKVRPALRLSLPILAGEGAALAFNVGARVVNALRAAGILAGDAANLDGISPHFDLVAILRTWVMQISAGFPTPRENGILFLTGLAMLSAPALLIAVSPKYQQDGNVDWRHGYIPQTVESFGVGLMTAAVLIWLLRWARQQGWWPRRRAVVSVLLAAGMAAVADPGFLCGRRPRLHRLWRGGGGGDRRPSGHRGSGGL